MSEPDEGTQTRELSRLMALAASADTGNREEIIAALDSHLDQEPDGNLFMLWHALWQSAEYHGEHRNSIEESQLRRLASLSDELGDPVLSARAYGQLAQSCYRSNSLAEAITVAEHACDLARKLPAGNTEFVRALMILAAAEAQSGKISEAVTRCGQLLEPAEHVPALLRVSAQRAAAIVYAQADDYETARAVIETAMAGIDSHDDPVLWLRVRLAAVSFYLQVQPPALDLAAGLLDGVQQLVSYIGSERHVQEALLLRARIAVGQGDYAQAKSIVGDLKFEEPFLNARDIFWLDIVDGQVRIAENHP